MPAKKVAPSASPSLPAFNPPNLEGLALMLGQLNATMHHFGGDDRPAEPSSEEHRADAEEKEMSAGIDYGGGVTNVDPETRIRYGVISMNGEACQTLGDSLEAVYAFCCPKCGDEDSLIDPDTDEGIKKLSDLEHDDEKTYEVSTDRFCLRCREGFDVEECSSEDPIGWEYDDEGYKLVDCLETNVMVLKSPYYTLAKFCSPCVPGAGDLDSPIDDGVKSYCLGHDWFEEGKAPYRVFRVEDGVELVAVKKRVPCVNCKGSGRDSLQRIAMARRESVDALRADEEFMKMLRERNKFDEYPGDEFECFCCAGVGLLEEVVTEEVPK